MSRFAGLVARVGIGLALLGAGAAWTRPHASAEQTAPEQTAAEQTDKGPPAVELKPQDINLWEHKIGPDAAIHLSAEEYAEARKDRVFIGREYVEFEIVVSENGRVDSARVVDGTKIHVDEAQQIEMARVFKPWTQDGSIVRVKLRDYVQLLPPERWADVRVPFPEAWDLASVSIGLKRTSCYGSCPSYEVTIAGDGTIHFSGGAVGVQIPGDHIAHISPEAVRLLVQEFRRADFFSARDQYEGNWTDNPTQTLTLSVAGRTKTVVDYVGTDAGLPLAIRNLENEIDEVAGTVRWVKGDERTLASLDEEKWPFTAATKQNVALYDTAISTNNQPLVQRFLAVHGPIVSPDPNVASPVCVASAIGASALVDRMMEPAAAKGEAPKKPRIPAAVAQQCLRSAAGSGNVALLQYWLDAGADPAARPVKNDTDWTSEWGILPHGVMSGNPEMVRKLLRYKVDVNERIQDAPLLIFVFQRSRGTPEQKAEIVEMLAKAGADVNAHDFMGQTPIFAAEYTPQAIKPLLAAGADLEARDNNGNTALIRFAFMEPMVRELLADGADPTAVAKNGDTALKVAKRYPGWPVCVTMIEEAIKQRAPGGAAVSNSQ
jgi:hypothetical protein